MSYKELNDDQLGVISGGTKKMGDHTIYTKNEIKQLTPGQKVRYYEYNEYVGEAFFSQILSNGYAEFKIDNHASFRVYQGSSFTVGPIE